MITIKIPTLRDLLVWLKVKKFEEAEKRTKKNRETVENFYKKVLWHIDREPIPEMNKEYLRKRVTEEYENVALYPVQSYTKKK